MNPCRRHVLGRAAAVAALAVARPVRAAAPQVAVVGAGWAGLAALHTLRRSWPAASVTLFDRAAQFRSLPLSNAWLAGVADEQLPRVDLAAHAAARGARFERVTLDALDRERRELRAGAQRWRYDALLLATGAEADPAAWPLVDAAAVDAVRTRWCAGYAAPELDDVRRRLQAWTRGTLLITVPPPPLRCPPAPYERALLLADRLRQQGHPGRIVLLDAGAGVPRLNRLIADRHAGRIEHHLHVQLQAIDPQARRIDCTAGDLRWDEALLLPPMHAGALLRGAGLTRSGRWAAVDADTLRSPLDDRIWLAGDALGHVSPLFGAYPKTAEIAAALGTAAALQLAASMQGRDIGAAPLPHSHCHLWLQADPPEQLVLQATYRRRGDGLIAQAVRQIDNPQPRGEDLAWARGLRATRLGLSD